jgi:hypothetical protein
MRVGVRFGAGEQADVPDLSSVSPIVDGAAEPMHSLAPTVEAT